ncbi:hypothetical protein [Streptomyces sp. NPDC054887]
MDDSGVAETNDPHVNLLWERHGREVRIVFAVDGELAPPIATDLPLGSSPA